jgi:hypothetical protein
LVAQPGQPERYDYEYQRKGTCNRFTFFQPLAGWRQVKVTEQRTMVEIELSVLVNQCLDRRIPAVVTLEREIAPWERERNEQGATVNWRFTVADARTKLQRFYPS